MPNPTPEELCLRWARPDDAAVIARLVDEFRAEMGEPVGYTTRETILRDGFGEVPNFEVILAETAGALCGYTLFMPSYEPTYAARGLYMADLYVAPDKRKQGIGRALIASVANVARQRERSFIWWVAMAENTRAHKFYDGLGIASMPVFANAATRLNVFDRLADMAMPVAG